MKKLTQTLRLHNKFKNANLVSFRVHDMVFPNWRLHFINSRIFGLMFYRENQINTKNIWDHFAKSNVLGSGYIKDVEKHSSIFRKRDK